MRYFSITCPQRALRLFSSVQHTLNRQTPPPNSLKRREFDEIYSPLKSQNFDEITGFLTGSCEGAYFAVRNWARFRQNAVRSQNYDFLQQIKAAP